MKIHFNEAEIESILIDAAVDQVHKYKFNTVEMQEDGSAIISYDPEPEQAKQPAKKESWWSRFRSPPVKLLPV